SGRQPSGGSVCAILGRRIEGNRCDWGSLMNSVDDGFEYCNAPGRQADARSDYDTVVAGRSQQTLDRRSGGFIGPNEANIGLPSACSELLQRSRNTCANLLSGHTWWQSWVGKIDGIRIVADQQNPGHGSLPAKANHLPISASKGDAPLCLAPVGRRAYKLPLRNEGGGRVIFHLDRGPTAGPRDVTRESANVGDDERA